MKIFILLSSLVLMSCSSNVKKIKVDHEDLSSSQAKSMVRQLNFHLENHPGFNRIKKRFGFAKVYVAQIQNRSNLDVPVEYINEELNHELPRGFEYVAERYRNAIDADANYAMDGMVDDETFDRIRREVAPDAIAYGYIMNNVLENRKEIILVMTIMDADNEAELVQIRTKVDSY